MAAAKISWLGTAALVVFVVGVVPYVALAAGRELSRELASATSLNRWMWSAPVVRAIATSCGWERALTLDTALRYAYEPSTGQ